MLWVNFPSSWNLSSIRAVLAFIINVLCAIGIWVSSYTSWRWSLRKLKNAPKVPLISTISVSGVGEAAETVMALNPVFGFIPRFHPILVQCAIVLVLSVTAILSGPIAKFCTQYNYVIRQGDVAGVLATANHTGQLDALVDWNKTADRLKQAHFPQDQLLDFLPDVEVDWLYEQSQWNSSWSLMCNKTQLTPINMTTTGDTGRYNFNELDGFEAAFPPDILNNWSSYRHRFDWKAYRNDDIYQDVFLVWWTSTSPSRNASDWIRTKSNNGTMRLVFAALHMHKVLLSDSDELNFGVGPVESARFTSLDCTLSRDPRPQADPILSAYPWTNDSLTIVTSTTQFYGARFIKESIAEGEIFHPSPDDLITFLQAYMINKDSQNKVKAVRAMNVRVQTAAISAAALVVLLSYCLLLFFTLLSAVAFASHPSGKMIPRTKVEWVMHAMKEAYGHSFDKRAFDKTWHELRADISGATFGVTQDFENSQHVGISRDKS